jgi:general secretion pathway protein N
MRVAGILVLVALLAAAALAAFAPASLADQALVRASAGRLRLANADGTLWRGAAELTDAVNAWRAPLRWRIAPLAWVTGSRELVLEPAAGADTPAGTIAIGKDGASLRDFRATVPASAFLSLASTRNAVTLGGNVTVTTADGSNKVATGIVKVTDGLKSFSMSHSALTFQIGRASCRERVYRSV